MQRLRLPALLSACLVLTAPASALELDPQIPAYKPVGALSGEVKAVGSDTLSVVMKQWADGFKALYPNVKIDLQSQGSSTAPPALTSGAAQLGPMSRPMTSEEIDAFQAKFGYAPTAAPVAVDAIAIYVNKDNPIKCLTIPQLDQIFSKTHLYSGGIDVTNWGGVGLTGDWAGKPVALFGRNAESGTHDTFVNAVLAHGEFKDQVKQEADSAEVVKHVAADKFAIGYSGIGFLTDGVRAVALAASSASNCYEPTWESALAGNYPLERFLYVYVNKDPKKALDPAVEEFVKYVVSKPGQAETLKAGLYPLIASTRLNALRRLGIAVETQ